MKNLTEATVNKIKEEHIKPKPRWSFVAKNFTVWIFCLLLVLLGAISFSLIFYLIAQVDWDIAGPSGHGKTGLIFLTVPRLWLALIIIFLVSAFIAVRHTRKGYRLNGYVIVGGGLLLVSLLGLLVRYSRTDEKINRVFSQNIPNYHYLAGGKERQWSQPDLGFLGGEVIKVQENNFDLKDFQGESWQISYDQDTLIKPSVELRPKEKIKVIGEKNDSERFHAREIRPWEGKGMPQNKMGERRRGNNK